jgi:prefoldin subunit 5
MLVKSELLDGLNHATALQVDLAHALDKRDILAADVSTITAQIAELEARLSAVQKGIALLEKAKGSGRS